MSKTIEQPITKSGPETMTMWFRSLASDQRPNIDERDRALRYPPQMARLISRQVFPWRGISPVGLGPGFSFP